MMSNRRIDRLVLGRLPLVRVVLGCLVMFVAWPVDPAHCDTQKLKRRIEQLVADLDADQYSVRNTAHQKLRDIGDAALAQLAKATKSNSTELRYRARQIILEIRRRVLVTGFTELANQSEKEMDLDKGMWLIARIVNHQLSRAELDRKLDELVAAVQSRLGKGVDASSAPPRKVVEVMTHVLKVEYKFSGNVEDYDNPANSSIDRVIETKKGLPILLSHVAISVAQRMKVPLVGLQVPSRYMIKYNGEDAPDGQPKDDIIIDPYGGWEVLTPEQVKQIIPSFDPAEHLVPSQRRLALQRMLRNLISDFGSAELPAKAAEANEYLLILQSAGVDE